MTNTTILTEAQIAEIEAAQIKRRESLAFHQSEYPGLPSPPYINEIDALIATVRSLQAERDALRDSASLVAFQAHQIDERVAASLIDGYRSRILAAVQAKADEWDARVANSDDETFKYHYRTRADTAREILKLVEGLV